MWYHYDWVHTYQINMGGKLKYLSKTAQRTVHLIISLYILLGNNLQRYKAFTNNRKQPSTVNKHFCRSGHCNKLNLQDSKFSCLVFVHVEKQRFEDANFSGGEMILIAVGSPGWKDSKICHLNYTTLSL